MNSTNNSDNLPTFILSDFFDEDDELDKILELFQDTQADNATPWVVFFSEFRTAIVSAFSR